MANPKFFPVVLLLILFIAFHVHARESQFFSKFTANSDANPVGPSNERLESLEKQSQDPTSFVAESQNGFGLYGHESGQLPPSDTASDDEPYYNKDAFAEEDETVTDDTKAMLQGSYNSAAVNNYLPEKSYGNVVANGRNNYYAIGNRYAANDDNDVQQQEGMSDTRFVENGKYYDSNSLDNYEKYPDSWNDEMAWAGGYEPIKDMNEFWGRKNVDEEELMT